MKIERKWAMPNKNTFDIKPIRELIEQEITEGLWIDPFANKSKLATITNDIDSSYDTDYHMDALDFLKMFEDNSVDGVLYDPPYSPRQVAECYKKLGKTVNMQTTQASYWSNHKKEIARYVYSIQYHIVWCVKYRHKILSDKIEQTNEKLKAMVFDETLEESKARQRAYRHSDYMEKQDIEYLFKLLSKHI